MWIGVDCDCVMSVIGFGIVVIDKFVGMISYDVVGWCCCIFVIWWVGYVGILDLMVIGVLVIGIECVIKIFGLLMVVFKLYVVIICLG